LMPFSFLPQLFYGTRNPAKAGRNPNRYTIPFLCTFEPQWLNCYKNTMFRTKR
jgi:hypothetical protein